MSQSSSNGAPSGAPTSLAERVDHEALAYHAEGTPEGEFLARQMEKLAQLIRWTGASTPEDHEDRMEVWEGQIRDQWYDGGHSDGTRQGIEIGRAEVLNMLKSISYQRN